MLRIAIFATQLLLVLGSVSFAFATGREAERRGAVWYGANYLLTTALASVLNSPTLNLVLDGICATGFLPLAVIYVSWWAGAVALLSASLFTLEAAYLIQEIDVDLFYVAVNNVIVMGTALVFLACGFASLRARRAAPPVSPANAHLAGA